MYFRYSFNCKLSLVFAVAAVILSLYLSRRLARPVLDMSVAIRSHELGQPLPPLPTGRHDEIGDLARSFVVVTNAHNQQALELKSAMKQLMESEKLAALGKLVAGVAHELNTPLGNIRTVATTLHKHVQDMKSTIADNTLRRSTLDDFVVNTEVASDLIDRNSHRAAELIESFKRMAVDQASEARRAYDLFKVVNESINTTAPSYKAKPVKIINQVPAGIAMDGYPGALSQVVINLVSNAIVHAMGNRDSLQITLTASDNGSSVGLKIEDDGIGMIESTAKRALEPFFTTRLGSGGSGLGLYLVYNLVTGTLGGTMQFVSTPGKGTCFDIIFPKTAPEASAKNPRPQI